jgi:hypothetical protein
MPKRIEERRRRNVVPGETVVRRDEPVVVPELPRRPRPHPVAVAWYEALRESGQSEYYEPSDWAAAVYVVQVITRSLRPGATAAMMSAAWEMMEALLTTEASRRRARIQVQRAIDALEGPQPTALEEYRARLGS